MRRRALRHGVLAGLLLAAAAGGAEPTAPISDDSDACLACHEEITPGIVADWRASRHARVVPAAAVQLPALQRRFSAAAVDEARANVVVGCAECHTARADAHADTFEHNGYRVHVVVTPDDCDTCHPVERAQYRDNRMAHAYGNLVHNPLYRDLMNVINGHQSFVAGELSYHHPGALSDADSCLSCHGTQLAVEGVESRDTPLGEMDFPVLRGWPNQGVGRINPDASLGACTACHPRHQFSLEVARKPYTCSQCHKGPDVPGYPVYMVSKHGNIYDSLEAQWDFDAVPWVVGRDFSAPTCATCHISLVSTETGAVVVARSHAMSNRLAWRIFGLVYAHPQPLAPDSSALRNAAGLALPTELDGQPLAEGLIDAATRAAREAEMQGLCLACHSSQWVAGHYSKYWDTIDTTNAMTRTATEMVRAAWASGVATGPAAGGSPFDEWIEQQWIRQWLFYGNSTRYAAAMGGADYGVFANGRFWQASNLQQMRALLRWSTTPAPPP